MNKGQWDKVIVGLMVLTYTVVMSYFSIHRYNAFASSYDLANADQTVWNSIRGTFFSLSGTVGTVSRFNNHADLILAVISPIYLIWDNVRMLLITQSLLIGLAAVPIWLIGKLILKNKWLALGIAGTYLLNPTVTWANMYDFHGVTIAMMTLLFCLYFGMKKEWRWMYMFALLSALTKEEIPLILSVYGLILMIFDKEKKHGLTLFLGGMVWTGVMTFLVIPYFSESGTHWAWGWFQLNQAPGNHVGLSEKIMSIWIMIIGARNYYVTIFSQWLFLPVLGLPWTLLTGPDMLINTLSSHVETRNTIMHYESGIMPGMAVGTIFAIKHIGLLIKKYNNKFVITGQFAIVAILVIFIARLNYFYSPLPTTGAQWKLMYPIGADEIRFEKILQSLPKDASITASSEVRNHITHRINAYNLPDMVGKTDYVAIVDQGRTVGDIVPREYETSLIQQLSKDKAYQLISHLGHFYLYKKVI